MATAAGGGAAAGRDGGGDGLARAVRAGSYALSGAALLLCLFALATDSYNPFIYFRF